MWRLRVLEVERRVHVDEDEPAAGAVDSNVPCRDDPRDASDARAQPVALARRVLDAEDDGEDAVGSLVEVAREQRPRTVRVRAGDVERARQQVGQP